MGRQALAVTTVPAIFLHGALCHGPALCALLGSEPQAVAAFLPDAGHASGPDAPYPGLLRKGPGVAGLAVGCSDPETAARLEFYLDVTGHELTPGAVLVHGRSVALRIARLARPADQGQEAWSPDTWLARWGAVVTVAARDIAGLYGQQAAAVLAGRYMMILMQAAARIRAAALPATAPAGGPVRRVAAPDDVQVVRRAQPYARFFAVEEYDLSFRRFDGRMSAVVNRAAFLSADAAVVLPYDPVRDRVLVIEQFRVGPFARGDARPWLFEAIAGRVDGAETPQEAARREAGEEAGLNLAALLPVADYYPTPGAKAEFLYTYIGITDLPDGVAGTGGLASEAEDIRAHVLTFDDFMALVDGGEAGNAPLILLGLALARRRNAIRRRYGAPDAPPAA